MRLGHRAPVLSLVLLAHALAIGAALRGGEAPEQAPQLLAVTWLSEADAPRAAPRPAAAPAAVSRHDTSRSVAAAPATDAAAPTAAAPGAVPTGAATSQPGSDAAAPLTPASFDAAYLRNPPPAYPSLSRRLGEQGKVELRVYVTAEGAPESIELRHGSGFPRLDEAALDAVRRWRFAPARRGEAAVGAWVIVPVLFQLQR